MQGGETGGQLTNVWLRQRHRAAPGVGQRPAQRGVAPPQWPGVAGLLKPGTWKPTAQCPCRVELPRRLQCPSGSPWLVRAGSSGLAVKCTWWWWMRPSTVVDAAPKLRLLA